MKIVALGDSTTAGTPGFLSPVESPPKGSGDEKSQFAYWMMKAHPEWSVLNRGVNGEKSGQILKRFPRDVASEKPRVVIILAGVNDIYQGSPNEDTKENLRKMYDMTERLPARLVACTVLPYNTMSPRQAVARSDLNSWVKEESSRRGSSFCDTALAVSSESDRDRLAGTTDGLHPDVEGYRKMADELCIVVRRMV